MIEVGEYVRLKDGRIRQFKQYINEEVVEVNKELAASYPANYYMSNFC